MTDTNPTTAKEVALSLVRIANETVIAVAACHFPRALSNLIAFGDVIPYRDHTVWGSHGWYVSAQWHGKRTKAVSSRKGARVCAILCAN